MIERPVTVETQPQSETVAGDPTAQQCGRRLHPIGILGPHVAEHDRLALTTTPTGPPTRHAELLLCVALR
jgi:hypothetical protein